MYSPDMLLYGAVDIVHEDRNITIVEFEFGGRVTRGVARRDPEDPYDRTTGVVLALSRAYASMGRKLQKEAMGRNKHLADVRADQARKALDKAADIVANAILEKHPEIVKVPAAEKRVTKRVVVKKAAKKKTAKKAK